jgi:LPS export ABC transporter protein LptC
MGSFLKRQWPLGGLALLLGLVAFYVIRAGTDAFQNSVVKGIVPGEGLNLRDIHYTQDDPRGGMKWVLDAKEVRFSGDKNFIFFYDFRVRLEPEGRPMIQVSGDRGDYSRNSGEINLWGNVRGVSEDGYKVVTEHMRIDERKRLLGTDEAVRMSGPFFSVAGTGLRLDLEKETVRILKNVRTVLNKRSLIS